MTNTTISTYKVTGVMSGTSLDGVDIAHCEFTFADGKWAFKVMEAETIPYSPVWKEALLNLEKTDGFTFQQTDVEYGYYLGDLVVESIKKHQLAIDFVASHGHTIFHAEFQNSILEKNKDKKLTTQIGAGSSIAATCKLPVICDFRSLDVALGGQGAPLVPIGDQQLFAEYDYCMNLGGFANVSYAHNATRIAYDICPVNIVMNEICKILGKEYDNNGELASQGNVNAALFTDLNQLSFYETPPNQPKSLGKEWVIENINPLLDKHRLNPNDLLRTLCEHVAIQVANSLNDKSPGTLLVTGGGTFNSFLMGRIKDLSSHQIIIPSNNIIEFKEAIIFAFLGVLRMRKEVNCLKSVTGAQQDSIGGAVYIS